MSRGLLTIVLLAALEGSWASRPACAQMPPATPPATAAKARPAPTASDLQAWVRDLDASEFLARETATLRLVAAGEPAIAAVQEVFRGDSLEATSRALYVLQQIGLSTDPQTQEAARAALVEAAASKDNPALPRRAAAALAHLTELRSRQALTELESLGAKVARAQTFDGAVVDDLVESLQIGPDFKGDGDDLRRLKWLKVNRLVFVGERVTDAWLAQAAGMLGLEELHLHSTAITAEGLAPLESHADLRQVGIYYTPLDAQGLAHLAKMPALGFLKLYGTKTLAADVARFQETSGVASVDVRKGAFLGVGCISADNSCAISTVHVGSPAEKAGLAPDDLILRFGGAKVTDFDTLTSLISRLDAGDTVEMEVQREVEDERGNVHLKQVTVKATLGPWGVDAAVQNGWRR
jgi:hypothetical protein